MKNGKNSQKNPAKKKRNNNSRMTQSGTMGATVYAPTARTKVVRTNRANVRSLPSGDIRVKHREYLFDVSSTTDNFTVATTPINPGIAGSFPWLSKIARNFESYRFNSLRYCYETEAATTLAGSMMLAVDYDCNDAAPATKQQIMTYRSSVRSAPWNPCIHNSTSEDLHKQVSFFVRSGQTLAANNDKKMYDVGNLFTATQLTGTNTLGEIYVEYDVLLMTPEFNSTEIIGGSVVAGGTITAANPLGSVPVPDVENFGFTVNNSSVITFTQLGDFVVTYAFVGTVITAAPATQVLGTGVTLLNASLGVIDAAQLNAMVRSEVRVNSLSGAQLDITLTATTITAGRVDVAIVPNGSLA